MQGSQDSGAALPEVAGESELVEDPARFVSEVPTHDVPGAEVHQVPVVDPIDASQVKLEQIPHEVLGRGAAGGLLGHDLDGPCPRFMDGTFQQLLDLVERHGLELLGEGEHLAHAHADKLVAFAVVTGAGLEVALELLTFDRRAVPLQCLDERLCARLRRRQVARLRPVHESATDRSSRTGDRPNAENSSGPNVVISAIRSSSIRSRSNLNARNLVSPGRRR